MSQACIKKRDQGWGAVYRKMAVDRCLNDSAVRAFAWLNSHSDQYKFTITKLKKCLDFGQQRWRTARDQLIKGGYLNVVISYNARGHKVYEYELFPEGGPSWQNPYLVQKSKKSASD